MVNQKGQEAAPFELLIAVILMGFVIIVGTFVVVELVKYTSEQHVNQKLEAFKDSLEMVAKNQGRQYLDFRLPDYGQNQEVKLIQLSDPLRCSSYCHDSRAVCTLVTFEAEGAKSMAKCINISPLTEFKAQADPYPCENRLDELLCLQDWRAGQIEQGVYVLVFNQTAAATAVPVICAYREVLDESDCVPI